MVGTSVVFDDLTVNKSGSYVLEFSANEGDLGLVSGLLFTPESKPTLGTQNRLCVAA